MARGDYPSDKQDQYMLRFPDGMRDQLKEVAAFNNRSLNAEIIARLSDVARLATELEASEIGRAQTEAARRALEAEVEALREQINAQPFQIGPEFVQSMARASKAKMAEFEDDLADLLNQHFPDAVLQIRPEDHWRANIAITDQLPEEYRAKWRSDVLKVCRLLAGDPEWLPPEERP